MNTFKKKIAALAASLVAAASVSVPLISAGASIGSIGEAVGYTLNYILTDDEMSEVRTSTVTVSGNEYVLKYGDAPEILSTGNTYNAGDINCDGVIDKADLDLLEAFLNGEDCEISEEGLFNADFDGDGDIDTTDYSYIEENLIFTNEFELTSLNDTWYTSPGEMLIVRMEYYNINGFYPEVEWSFVMDSYGEQTLIYESVESGVGYVDYMFYVTEEAVDGVVTMRITAENDFCSKTYDVYIEIDAPEPPAEVSFDLEYLWSGFQPYGEHWCVLECEDGFFNQDLVSVSGADLEVIGSAEVQWKSIDQTVTVSGLYDGTYTFTSKGYSEGTYGGGGVEETIVCFEIVDGQVTDLEVTSWNGYAENEGNAITVTVDSWRTTTTSTTTTSTTTTSATTTTTSPTTTSATTTQSNLTPLIIPSSLTMNIGDTAQLTVLNTNDETVTWLTNNTSVATVTDGTVTAVAEGTAVIYAVVGNAVCECTVTVNGASGILYGDADGDGELTITDVVVIMVHVVTPGGTLTAEQISIADVYQQGDGISNMDALAVQKRIAQLLTSLPESVL